MKEFAPGDPVIYRMPKYSACPGQRAQNIRPATRGESYSYDIDKFWLVDGVLEDGKLRLVTRRGKVRVLDSTDTHLRKPRWWERLVYRGRFPQMGEEAR